MTSIDIDVSGPIFDGRADDAVAAFCRDATREVAAQGRADVAQNLDRSIRRPTPYYETQINVRELGPTTHLVNDRHIVYGPWLEGTSSRNQTTRFRGYAAFRRAAQALRPKVPALVRAALDRCIRRMGG